MADTQIVKVDGQKTYSSTYLVGALIAGIIVGVLFSFVWFKTGKTQPLTVTGGDSKNDQMNATAPMPAASAAQPSAPSAPSAPVHTDEASKDTGAPANSGGALAIADQPAGLEIKVAQAQVSSDQWVVIREAKNGQPGNVLGAARFVGGATSGAVVLLRNTVAGSVYYGMIYKDNGDRTFSLADDTPILDASGNPILVSFTAR